ncbi:MAG: antitoxin [Treponema sp.]|nr:antitoxin [Treponema sp.]
MKEIQFFNREEQELIDSIEKDQWKSTGDIENWKTLLAQTATNTLTKDQRMNIRITKNDLDGIKLKAMEEGIPYQTLVASIIHKYVTGKLSERIPETV